jgi:hypothetical protein
MASLAPSVSRQDRAFRFSADRKCDDTTGETTTNMVVESRFFIFPDQIQALHLRLKMEIHPVD